MGQQKFAHRLATQTKQLFLRICLSFLRDYDQAFVKTIYSITKSGGRLHFTVSPQKIFTTNAALHLILINNFRLGTFLVVCMRTLTSNGFATKIYARDSSRINREPTICHNLLQRGASFIVRLIGRQNSAQQHLQRFGVMRQGFSSFPQAE